MLGAEQYSFGADGGMGRKGGCWRDRELDLAPVGGVFWGCGWIVSIHLAVDRRVDTEWKGASEQAL